MKIAYTPITEEELARVRLETEESDRTEPRIDKTTYDNRNRLLHLVMRGGAGVNIPIDVFDEFNEATPKQIANCQPHENGASLHWDELDIQIETISILQIAFRFRTVADNSHNGAKSGRTKKKVAA